MISFTELAKWLVLSIRLRSHSTSTFFGFKRPYLGNRSEIAPAALSSSPSAHDLSVGTAASESPRAESTPAANLPPRLRAARPRDAARGGRTRVSPAGGDRSRDSDRAGPGDRTARVLRSRGNSRIECSTDLLTRASESTGRVRPGDRTARERVRRPFSAPGPRAREHWFEEPARIIQTIINDIINDDDNK